MKLQLPQVTLIAVAGNRQGETVASMYKSMTQVDFARCVLITNVDLTATGVEVINVGGLETWEAYNHFIVKELYKYFYTEYCLIVQWDSWVLNADSWTNEFLDFDYIGAKWLDIGKPYNCGNGGFSLRSMRLQTVLGTDANIITTCPEDVAICKVYGQYLVDKYGIEFCTEEIADQFSFELNQPLQKTFGFHAFHQEPYRETVVIKRSGAMGDVIMAEPVLAYFYEQGYRVVLDTQPEFMKIYMQHYFTILPKSFLHPQTTYREINLDYCYEINPTRPVLESFYEIAGIKDYPLRNSQLNLWSGDNQKIFRKYCIIHIDETGMPYRNQYGINWKYIVMFLEERGYLVFQIGRRIEKEIATYLNTMSIDFMMFIIKGADLFIGLDSGCAQVAAGFNVPSVIFFGSVNPMLRYTNFDRIRVVQSQCPKPETKHCYHSKVDTVGKDCVYDKELPPCTTYSSTQVIEAIKQLHDKTRMETANS